MRTSIGIAEASGDENQTTFPEEDGRQQAETLVGVADVGCRPGEGAWPSPEYSATPGSEARPTVFPPRVVGAPSMSDGARAIIWNVAVRRNVRPEDIVSPRRTDRVVRARVAVLKQLAARGYSSNHIGTILGLDHSTVLYHLGRLAGRSPMPEVLCWHRPRIRHLLQIKRLPPPKEPAARRCKRQLVPYAGFETGSRPEWGKHRSSPPSNARS